MFRDVDWDRSADAAAMIARLFPLRSEGSRVEVGRCERLYYCALARRGRLSPAGQALLGWAERLADGDFLNPFPFQAASEVAEYLAACEGDPIQHEQICQALRRLGIPCESIGPSVEHWHRTHYPLVVALIENGPGTRFPELRHDADRIRDIFPRPDGTRPEFPPRWRTQRIVALAREQYIENQFTRMPLLGDMLADAGCDDESVLQHCQDEQQPHARGCWVVDLVLGR
jgi:hypothetical protein